MSLRYTKHESVSLKNHSEFNERWLQDQIAEDTSILGLGELVLIERERQQEHAGRLDLLLADTDKDRRYEVELQLGKADESHIIRCIEYWDIERRRYPGYDHIAVLVAEDVTSRFLNILGLFAGTIPLVVIQLNALQVGDQLVLDPVRVLDQRTLRRDVVDPKLTEVNRSYWVERVGNEIVSMADDLLAVINESASPQQQLNFNKYYIGLSDGARIRNFINFRPKKKFLHLLASLPDVETWVERCDEAGLQARDDRDGGFRLRVTLKPADLDKHRELLADILRSAVELHQA